MPPRAGSLQSEEGSGGLHAYARNRLTQIQSWFRQKPVWNFFMLDRLHKATLFFRHKKRGQACACVSQEESLTSVNEIPKLSRGSLDRDCASLDK